ncbi:MAG: T9SS type A sorting domain-containing protein [Fluviicola sp.]|nr:T9SS type A sorting domain-containing protein [Fluviicola sp.]
MNFKTTIKNYAVLLSFLLVCNLSFSQVLVNIDVSGISFTPSSITINVGDTVRWTNSSGTHNVNATTATYPGNPASFGNSLGTGWVFTHIFTVAGSYDYRCDAHFNSGMAGTITVQAPASLEENSIVKSLIFPIPASNSITIELNQDNTEDLAIKIVDVKGAVVYTNDKISGNTLTIDSKEWSGTYFYQLYRNDEIIESKKLIVE